MTHVFFEGLQQAQFLIAAEVELAALGLGEERAPWEALQTGQDRGKEVLAELTGAWEVGWWGRRF